MSVTPARGQYRQIADQIRARIQGGEFPRGSTLPPEDDLAQEFGVSRPVINRAVSILRAEGLVRVERGRGTFVSEIPPIRRDAASRYSKAARERAGGRGAFDTEITRMGKTPKSVQQVEPRVPPAPVAEILGVSATEASTVVRARRMYADDVPIQIADSYIPLDIASGTALEQTDSGPGGIISRFAELGYAQTRISEVLNVRSPSAEEAEFLRMAEDQRVYEVTHVGRTAEGRAVEVCIHVMPTHQWQLEYSWDADPPEA